MSALLRVQGLCTEFSTRGGIATAVDDVSFSVAPGQIMGLVGESGSGKSMTGYSIMGLIDPPGPGLWITHDLSVVAGLADTVCVMYAGKIVESGSTAQVLNQPRHHYTRGRIASAPSRNAPGAPLYQIAGMTPSLLNLKPGCAFRAPCAAATGVCAAPPPLASQDGRTLRCFHPVEPAIA